jgi:hypothetical protein
VAYKNPESKREGCYYPNCSGYLEVPFCCHDPKALPALKARLAQLETPKREWVGLTDDEINDFDKKLRDNGDYCSLHFAWGISAKLKEKNDAV